MNDRTEARIDRLRAALVSARRSAPRLVLTAKILGALAVLAVLIIAVAGPATLATPRSCAACHAPAAAAASLRTSPHSSVRCERCHVDRASFGGLGNSAALLSDVGRQVGGGISETSRVPDSACASCHAPAALRKTKVSSSGLRMSHAGLAQGGYRCVDCHSSVAHTPSAGRLVGARMSTCARCHNNVKVSGECETCHTEKRSSRSARDLDPEWSKTHGADWKRLHGMGDLSTCTLCHSTNDCKKCHGVELPHTGTFIGTHGKVALADSKPCYVCHQPSYCSGCHGVEMPHPAGFLKGHPAKAKADNQLCMRCHTQPNCDECHTKHIHPGGASK